MPLRLNASTVRVQAQPMLGNNAMNWMSPVGSEFENFVFKGPVRPSEDDLNYIMFGLEHLDGKWGGAHLFGQGRGKSEFPETWNKMIISEAIIRVQLLQFFDGNFPKPRVRYFSRVWDVVIMVGFLEDEATGQLYVSTAYPLRGVGVFQNKNGTRRNLPLRPED